jgi:hypothetical protein
MFEITGDDIAALSDGDLRNLVALLCEAELRKRGLPTSAVTAGGHQDAPDGGVDVRVALPAGTVIDGFVPRANTVFQVKKPDMPRGEILKEMKPSGTVRAAIQELVKLSGAYIIVSGAGSTTDTALKERRAAMAEAIALLENANQLVLDFYDRGRLATWVRSHPGWVQWMRQRVGKALQGWHSYGAWAYPPEGLTGEYLADDKLRIRTGEEDDGGGLGALAGIERIRDVLRKPRKVVRLVGLSGVGKTRLVQVLFDERVGKRPLDPATAVYTNLADGPDPQPIGLASDLIAQGSRAILVVDNCPPDLHRRLSELCRSPESLVSVLTVEYDIREDEQEGTDVFKLEPSSKELVEKLIQRRFQNVSQVDAGTIAEFSGGNARVAMALAATVGKGETITGLKDAELFRRLFQQGHQHDDSLLRIAQACSLVYSFQGEALAGEEAELPRLAALIGKSPEEVYAGVTELLRRDLAQKRSVWRAVLSHAIANRLAMLALQNIPLAAVEAQLVTGAPERILKSFSRRLGYLDEAQEAVAIVKGWLAPNGLLGNVAELDAVKAEMLKNVAPAAPDAVLDALERGITGSTSAGGGMISNYLPFTGLLRSIAYDSKHFQRCVTLLANLAAGEDSGDSDDWGGNDPERALNSLFTIGLSGTHATIEQRLAVVEELARSNSAKRQELGLAALGKLLDTGPFSSSYDFEFGARSRDHGYWPRTEKDVQHWFGSVLRFAQALISSGSSSEEVRALLARKFRGLWSAGMGDELAQLFRKLGENGTWREGWIAVRQTQQYDGKKMLPDTAKSLAELEKTLRPEQLADKVRAIVLSGKAGRLDLDEADGDDDITTAMQRRATLVRDLGGETAKDQAVFAELLPDLVASRGQLFDFGRGLAAGAEEPGVMWQEVVSAFGKAPQPKRNALLLGAFLSGLQDRDPTLAEAALDEAVEDETLGPLFPALQTSVPIDAAGVERLRQSMAHGLAQAEAFRVLAYGRSSDPIPPSDLKQLLISIAALENGLDVAIDILHMHMFSDRDQKKKNDTSELVEAGRLLLSRLEFGDDNDRADSERESVVRACLDNAEGAATAKAMCERLRAAVAADATHASYHEGVLGALLRSQPLASLDGLFGGNEEELERGLELISDLRLLDRNPMEALSTEAIGQWCDAAPQTRYAIAAAFINFSTTSENGGPEWNAVALRLLENSPSRVDFLKRVVERFWPMSWSGSRAAIAEANAKLLDQLPSYNDPALAQFITQEKVRLAVEIEAERRSETKHDKDSDERFE